MVYVSTRGLEEGKHNLPRAHHLLGVYVSYLAPFTTSTSGR